MLRKFLAVALRRSDESNALGLELRHYCVGRVITRIGRDENLEIGTALSELHGFPQFFPDPPLLITGCDDQGESGLRLAARTRASLGIAQHEQDQRIQEIAVDGAQCTDNDRGQRNHLFARWSDKLRFDYPVVESPVWPRVGIVGCHGLAGAFYVTPIKKIVSLISIGRFAGR